MISIIVAMDKNHAIGKDNLIPWRIRSDIIRLKQMTLGHTVILGRKTYDSMAGYYDRSGRPMPAACYIIVTRSKTYKPTRANARIAHSIEEAIELAESLDDENIFAIGGSEIYASIIDATQRLYITEVDAEIDGDTYFPKLNPDEWRETSRQHFQKNEKDEYDFSCVILDRVR